MTRPCLAVLAGIALAAALPARARPGSTRAATSAPAPPSRSLVDLQDADSDIVAIWSDGGRTVFRPGDARRCTYRMETSRDARRTPLLSQDRAWLLARRTCWAGGRSRVFFELLSLRDRRAYGPRDLGPKIGRAGLLGARFEGAGAGEALVVEPPDGKGSPVRIPVAGLRDLVRRYATKR